MIKECVRIKQIVYEIILFYTNFLKLTISCVLQYVIHNRGSINIENSNLMYKTKIMTYIATGITASSREKTKI